MFTAVVCAIGGKKKISGISVAALPAKVDDGVLPKLQTGDSWMFEYIAWVDQNHVVFRHLN